MNKVVLVGTLGKNPTMHTASNGKKYATFPVATSESWIDKETGEPKEETEWHERIIFGGRSEFVGNHLRKGDVVSILGKNKTKEKDGKYYRNVQVEEIDPVNWRSKRKEKEEKEEIPTLCGQCLNIHGYKYHSRI